MVDNKRFQKIKKFIFKNSRADDVQVLYTSSVSYLTRLANSYIHQNVHENTETLIVNSIFGKKIGVATTRDLSEKNIIKTIRIAEAIAKNRPEDPDYPGLPLGAEIFYTDKFNEKSSGTTPQQRANILKDIVKICNKSGVNASGYVSTDFSNFAVATTKGADCFCALSNAHLFIITDKGFATGFAEDENIDFFKLNHEKVAKIAVEKCLKSVDPISVEPGDYTVILEEPAVGEMLAYFNYIAFNTKSYYEGRSALSGKLGKQVAGKNITIVENWKHPKGQGMPFDAQGVPKKKVVLIENGQVKNMVYDYYHALKFKQKNTGHALLPQMVYGPMPLNLVLESGKDTPENMIKSTKHGILVTRFHYTNIIDPIKTLYTGMTRNGTFLIKDGKIHKGIKNLRFTQSILEALNNVKQISKSQVFSGGFMGGGSIIPQLKIDNFTFTGKTEF